MVCWGETITRMYNVFAKSTQSFEKLWRANKLS
jgi:hypothetical protein